MGSLIVSHTGANNMLYEAEQDDGTRSPNLALPAYFTTSFKKYFTMFLSRSILRSWEIARGSFSFQQDMMVSEIQTWSLLGQILRQRGLAECQIEILNASSAHAT